MNESESVGGLTMPLAAGVIALIFGCIAVLLVAANIVLESMTASAQSELNQRQAFINDTAEVRRIDQELVRALATVAGTKHDVQLDAMLKQAGITYTLTSPAPAASAAPAKP